VDTNATEAGRARNRRVEVNLVYDETLVNKVGPPKPVKNLPEEQLYFDAAEKQRQVKADRKTSVRKPLPPLERSWADEFSLESSRSKGAASRNAVVIDSCPGCDV
jgi:hypothetical protein